MSKRNFLLTLTLFLGMSIHQRVFAQIQLSKDATISMVTIGPYDPELWSSWGHSVIRVYDPHQNIDWSYDYGRFSFEQTNFYWNYALGKTYYSIGKSERYPAYVNLWRKRNRSVIEQVMNFTPEEVQKAFDILERNNQPENREYLYNYVYDNCATRLIDLVDLTLPGQVTFDETFMKEDLTIRDLMDEGLEFQPWGDLVIDLFLGSQIDHVANHQEHLMMPDYVRQSLAKSTINRNGNTVPLVRNERIVYQAKPENLANGILTPFNVFVLLFFVVGFITNRNFKTLRRTKWIDYVLFSLVGFLGLICAFLWFGTEHLSKYNWNLLWAIPFHLPAIWMTRKEKYQPFLIRYFRFTGVLYGLTLLFWVILPQPLHQSLIPLVLLLTLRAFYISFDLSRLG